MGVRLQKTLVGRVFHHGNVGHRIGLQVAILARDATLRQFAPYRM